MPFFCYITKTGYIEVYKKTIDGSFIKYPNQAILKFLHDQPIGDSIGIATLKRSKRFKRMMDDIISDDFPKTPREDNDFYSYCIGPNGSFVTTTFDHPISSIDDIVNIYGKGSVIIFSTSPSFF